VGGARDRALRQCLGPQARPARRENGHRARRTPETPAGGRLTGVKHVLCRDPTVGCQCPRDRASATEAADAASAIKASSQMLYLDVRELTSMVIARRLPVYPARVDPVHGRCLVSVAPADRRESL
jgi:hypothetical protein